MLVYILFTTVYSLRITYYLLPTLYYLLFSTCSLLFISHYFLPRVPNTGWVGIKEKAPLIAEQQASRRQWKKRIAAVENFALSK